jgi:hypothetical protein
MFLFITTFEKSVEVLAEDGTRVEQGTLEGAIFASAHANDPEALVVLELSPASHRGATVLLACRQRGYGSAWTKKQAWFVEPYWTASSPASSRWVRNNHSLGPSR